jgi:hypothetical protein
MTRETRKDLVFKAYAKREIVTLALVARVHSSANEMPSSALTARLRDVSHVTAMDPRNKCEGDTYYSWIFRTPNTRQATALNNANPTIATMQLAA